MSSLLSDSELAKNLIEKANSIRKEAEKKALELEAAANALTEKNIPAIKQTNQDARSKTKAFYFDDIINFLKTRKTSSTLREICDYLNFIHGANKIQLEALKSALKRAIKNSDSTGIKRDPQHPEGGYYIYVK